MAAARDLPRSALSAQDSGAGRAGSDRSSRRTGYRVLSAFLSIPIKRGSITKQLYIGIRDRIIGGQIPKNARMPSQRSLAKHLGVSRGVIVAVYEQLAAADLMTSQTGSGTFIKFESEPQPDRVPHRYSLRLASFQADVRTSDADRKLWLTDNDQSALFSEPRWLAAERFAAKATDAPQAHREDAIRHIQCYISNRLMADNNIRCRPNNILPTKGTVPALSVIAAALADPGDTCIVEKPDYADSAAALRFSGLNVLPVHCDDEGLLPFNIDPAGVRMMVTSSAVRFQTGFQVSLRRKRQILDWARQYRITIIEDDQENCFGAYVQNRNSYCSIGNGDDVIYTCSLTKLFCNRLQLGFVVAPTELVERLQCLQSCHGMAPDARNLLTVAEFMSRGFFDQYIVNVRETVATRHDRLDVSNIRERGLVTTVSNGRSTNIAGARNLTARHERGELIC